MIDWKVGDQVVCVDDAPSNRIVRGYQTRKLLHGLTAGGVYEIRHIYYCGFFEEVSIYLVEIKRPVNLQTGAEAGYSVRRFRPVRKTDIRVFERLLVNLPIMEDAR